MGAELSIVKQADRADFLSLLADLLISHEKSGSDVRATERTLAYFTELCDAYINEDLVGLPLIARVDGAPAGALMWGALPPSPIDRTEENAVNGWGGYTVPEYRRQGISRALREMAIHELARLGVRVVLGGATLTNTPGIESSRATGFKPTQLLGVLDVQEEADKLTVRDMFGHGPLTDGFYWEGLCPLCGKE